MDISILMKLALLHKYRPKQISISLSICLLQILGTISIGREMDQSKQSERFAIGPALIFDHPDVSFVESLLNSGFFDIAIETCRDRYRMVEASQGDAAAQWSMLEMHSVAAKVAAGPAIIDDPASLPKLLAPNQIVLERNPDSPRLFWLKQQQQWCRWLVLRRMQAAYIAVPARKPIREWSLATIRDCLAELETLQLQIQKAPARNGKSNNKSDPTPDQWSSLINDNFLLQTDFLLLRALYYPAKSTERIAAAAEMLSALDNAELRISADWPGRPNIDLARCAALVHLDRPAEALSKIKSLVQRLTAQVEGKPKQVNRWRLRIASLAAEACRNLGNTMESNQWLESVGGWTVAPEIAIEHFANLVSAPVGPQNNEPKAIAVGQPISETQLANALQIKKEIGLRFGSYWQQRADAILLANHLLNSNDPGKAPAPTSTTLKIELLMSEAKQLLAAKRWDEAIEKLSQAELSAASSSNEKIALDIAIQAASVLFTNGQKEAAEDRFHRAAIAYNKQPKAPDAAIMSVWSFDKAVRFDASATALHPNDEEAELKQQMYCGRLMDIVNTWPNTTQANEAVTKLDRLFLATDQLTELIALWGQRLDHSSAVLTPNPKQWSDFDQALSRFALVCTATQDAWYDHSIFVTEAMKKLRPKLDELRTKLLDRANPNDRTVVRSILTSILDSSRWPSQNADTSNSQLNANPTSLAVSFLAKTAIAAQPTIREELFAKLDATHVDETTDLALIWTATELLFQQIIQFGMSKPIDPKDLTNFRSCVERLNAMVSQEDKLVIAGLGTFQSLQLVRSLQLYRVAIQCWSNEEATGVATIQAAIALENKIPWWTYRSARLFQTLGSQREKAIQQFRHLAKGFPVGSEPWLESRARTVQTMRQMGDAKGSKELTNFVFATFPAAAKEWQARFDR